MSSEEDLLVDRDLPVIPLDPWFGGLRETVLSCFTQSRMEMECAGGAVAGPGGGVGGHFKDDDFLPWTISTTLNILTSDADTQRKMLVEYISTTNGIKPLLELFECTVSFKVGEKTAKILRELLNPKSGKHRTVFVKQCVDMNYLTLSVAVLKQLVKGSGSSGSSNVSASTSPAIPHYESPEFCGCRGSNEEMDAALSTTLSYANSSSICNDLGNGAATTVDFIWFLAGVIAKDTRSPDKVRQMLKVKFFHDVFKRLFFAKSNMHFPLLKMLKILSKCRRSAEILGKDKVMNTVKKCFCVLNAQPNPKLLGLMDWLAFLTRDKKNSIRFLKAGLLVKVLNCFRHWVHWKGKGLLKLSKTVINIYTHLARTKSGKKSLLQSDAIGVIKQFCEQCPPERSFDDVMMRACAMIYICYGKDNLPLENLECPIKFEIPDTFAGSLETPVIDSGSSSDEDDPEGEGEINEDDSDDADSDNDNGSDRGSDSDICDDDEPGVGIVVYDDGMGRLSGGNSRRMSIEAEEERHERNLLDKISKYSYYFREFSSHYAQEEEMDNMLTKLEKLELAELGILNIPEGELGIEAEELSRLDQTCGDAGDAGRISKPGNLQALIPSASFPTSIHKYSWTSRHGVKLPRMDNLRKLYFHMANKIKHVSPFAKIAYPDICLGLSGKQIESLCANTDRAVLRRNVHTLIARAMCELPIYRQKVVYSLDDLLARDRASNAKAGDKSSGNTENTYLENNDEQEAGKFEPRQPLSFESRFESGNLRKAIQVGDYEYDLLLTSDINSSRHNQWFYFQIGNVSEEHSYVFNIINCIKTNSLFNYGMQPMVFSVMDAMKGKPGWIRSGSSICYYRNGYKCIGKKSVKTYHTLTFTLNFHNRGDIVYIAYYIPYTYSRLIVEVHNLLQTVQHSEKVHCRYDVLCKSLDGNNIPLLTITAPMGGDNSSMQKRDVVFLTSRVHPGETNASWVMMGILRKLLLGTQVEDLLQRFVFKIVPMLNVEGVVNGCHRSGLTSQDLNRCWKSPHEFLHPSIHNTKMLIAYCCKIRGKQPTVFLDLHGHSRRKNAFFYGCSYARSWKQEDRVTPENPHKLYALAESMSDHSPYFVIHFCHYDVRKSRETTARVAIWREFGITCSYTLECSYCGCDRGPSKGITFGSGQLWEIGEAVCEAISTMESKFENTSSQDELPLFQLKEDTSLEILDLKLNSSNNNIEQE